MIRILKAIKSNGSADVHEIKEAVNLSISRVRELVKEAIARGLVEGSPDADDIMIYELTAEGHLFLDPAMDDAEEETQDDEEEDADVPADLEEPAEVAAPVKAKRVVLNPQPVIDKKTAVLAEAGYALTYASRMWTIQNNETGLSVSFDSRTLASVKVAEIVDYARVNIDEYVSVEAPAAA